MDQSAPALVPSEPTVGHAAGHIVSQGNPSNERSTMAVPPGYSDQHNVPYVVCGSEPRIQYRASMYLIYTSDDVFSILGMYERFEHTRPFDIANTK